MDPVTEHARAVAEGRTIAWRLVRMAGRRHLSGSARRQRRPGRAAAGAGRLAEACPRRQLRVGPHGTGLRRFRKAYVQVAWGNGKSTKLSGLSLYMLMADGEASAEVYGRTTTRDQTRIVNEDRTRLPFERYTLYVDDLAKVYPICTSGVCSDILIQLAGVS